MTSNEIGTLEVPFGLFFIAIRGRSLPVWRFQGSNMPTAPARFSGPTGPRRQTQPSHDPAIRKAYKSARWQRFAKWFWRQECNSWCVGCGADLMGVEGKERAIDHRTPHRGDLAAFWAGPFDPMCASCHGKKAASERQGKIGDTGSFFETSTPRGTDPPAASNFRSGQGGEG